jgi:NADPH-dependent curcumin reductase CurA
MTEYGKNLEEIAQPRIYHKLFWKAASVRGFLIPLYQKYAAEA